MNQRRVSGVRKVGTAERSELQPAEARRNEAQKVGSVESPGLRESASSHASAVTALITTVAVRGTAIHQRIR